MQTQLASRLFSLLLLVPIGWQIAIPAVGANPLPPPTDIPEEVLRAEIITEARSPIDGKPLSAIEFAELTIDLQQQLSRSEAAVVSNNPRIKEVLFLLRLRGLLRSVGFPIK
jgi:hypothetical protein